MVDGSKSVERLIGKAAESQQPFAGTNVLRWDGRADDGQLVESNFYIVTVEGEGKLGTKTVVVKNH